MNAHKNETDVPAVDVRLATEAIREAVRDGRVSQRGLAEAAGLNLSTISRFATRKAGLTTESFARIAAAFGFSVALVKVLGVDGKVDFLIDPAVYNRLDTKSRNYTFTAMQLEDPQAGETMAVSEEPGDAELASAVLGMHKMSRETFFGMALRGTAQRIVLAACQRGILEPGEVRKALDRFKGEGRVRKANAELIGIIAKRSPDFPRTLTEEILAAQCGAAMHEPVETPEVVTPDKTPDVP